jgi:hypothetical protein
MLVKIIFNVNVPGRTLRMIAFCRTGFLPGGLIVGRAGCRAG